MRAHLLWLIFAFSALPSSASDAIYRLPLGDAARRDTELPVVLDTITDTARGDTLTTAELAGRLRDTRLLLVGESHISVEFHRAELQVIKALHASGRQVLIGLEMYPYTEQASLDAWGRGDMTEAQFVEQSRWYEHWGHHWNYYREIFLFARDAKIRMHAVNTPREVISAVRKKGFANLTPEERAHVPSEVDVDSADHLAFFKAALSDGDNVHPGMTDAALQGMLAAQATWDASMGWNAVQALKATGGPTAVMVVLVGSGHVAYGLGIERQARRWFDGPISTIVPVPIEDDEGKPIPLVRASYANFTWGVAGERDSAYPVLGVSSVAAEGGRRVIDVRKDGAGARGGVLVGDVLKTIDGQAVTGHDVFNKVMATKNWGDTVALGILRGAESLTLTVPLRRVPRAK